MKSPAESLANAEPLDLADASADESLSFLPAFAGFPFAGRSLLKHTQALMDAVLDEPPPASPSVADSTMTPWWSPMPAAYVAALFMHAGLPAVAQAPAEASWPPWGGPPHALESARIAAEALRQMGLPFVVRAHAALLIANQRKPAGLLGSGAPEGAYLRLACLLDLGALHCLKRAELQVARGIDAADREKEASRLDAFRAKAEQLGVFGRPCAPPLAAEQVARLGLEGRELHRAVNALRYFMAVARMGEQDWWAERLALERERPRGRLHLLIGPAGCGKSTWAAEHLAHTTIISSDRMREELTGDPSDQSQNYLVFQRCMDRVREGLRAGEEVTFDATNYSERLRSMPVQAARWSAAEIVSCFFDIAQDEALRRNERRQRAVPERVIRRHYRLITPPALYEADRHMVVDAEGHAAPYWPVASQDRGGDTDLLFRCGS